MTDLNKMGIGYEKTEGYGAEGTSSHSCYITATYQELLGIFGEPNGRNDGYKVSTEWILKPIGDKNTKLTIYDYKVCKEYDSSGIDVRKSNRLIEWHIGGNNVLAERCLEANVAKRLKELRG